MTACRGFTSACTGLDMRPVRFGVEEPRLLCAGCRSTALGREAGEVIERRVMRQYVAKDRRWKPVWRRASTVKDLTGALA